MVLSRIKRFLRPVLNKPAFLLHTAEIANHFSPIWVSLGAQPFDILVFEDDLLSNTRHSEYPNCTVRLISEVSASKQRYRVLVSTNPVVIPEKADGKEKALIQKLAKTNLRMMYAAGKSGWNMSDWNYLYDGVLCFGPHHAKVFSDKFGLATQQIGYPRFDKFFNTLLDRAKLQQQLNCDPEKPTVVWLPTWKGLSSVDHFNDEIASLLPKFNVVAKVHPLMPDDEPERVSNLQKLGLNALITDTSDNVPLYQLADYMLFDYGGPAFGAIYTDKKFVLLNVPGATQDTLAGEDSPDILLRKSLFNVDPSTNKLGSYLKDGPHWETHASEIASLRREYFAPNLGTSAKAAVSAILDRSWIKK